jgi:hypothetical protein
MVTHLLPLRVGELGNKLGQGVHTPDAPDHERAILAGTLNLAGAKHELVLLLQAEDREDQQGDALSHTHFSLLERDGRVWIRLHEFPQELGDRFSCVSQSTAT